MIQPSLTYSTLPPLLPSCLLSQQRKDNKQLRNTEYKTRPSKKVNKRSKRVIKITVLLIMLQCPSFTLPHPLLHQGNHNKHLHNEEYKIIASNKANNRRNRGMEITQSFNLPPCPSFTLPHPQSHQRNHNKWLRNTDYKIITIHKVNNRRNRGIKIIQSCSIYFGVLDLPSSVHNPIKRATTTD